MLGQMSLLRNLSRRRSIRPGRSSGLTLIELMVVVAVIGIIALVAAPSFRDMLELQRLKGVSAQFLTDVQFARSEAASRQEVAGISFPTGAAAGTCYIVHTCGTAALAICTCDCTSTPGARCAAPMREIKTVTLDPAVGVKIAPALVTGGSVAANRISFDPSTGRLASNYFSVFVMPTPPPSGEFWGLTSLTRSGAAASVRTEISLAGRPRNCSPGSVVSGVTAC